MERNTRRREHGHIIGGPAMRSCTRCALGKPAEARIAEQYIPALVKLVRELSSRFEGLTGTKPSSSDALAYMVTRHMAMRSHQQEDK